MTSLQDKIDTILDENHPTTDIQHFIVISEAIDKAIQELREQIKEVLDLALDAEQQDKVIAYKYTLDLIGEKSN